MLAAFEGPLPRMIDQNSRSRGVMLRLSTGLHPRRVRAGAFLWQKGRPRPLSGGQAPRECSQERAWGGSLTIRWHRRSSNAKILRVIRGGLDPHRVRGRRGNLHEQAFEDG